MENHETYQNTWNYESPENKTKRGKRVENNVQAEASEPRAGPLNSYGEGRGGGVHVLQAEVRPLFAGGLVELGEIHVHPGVIVVVDGRDPFHLDEVSGPGEEEAACCSPGASCEYGRVSNVLVRQGVRRPPGLLMDVPQDG